jgi:hypothetical protein
MARHRSGSPRSGRAGPGVSTPDAAPRTGSWPAALDAPATGPRPVRGKHRHDPATTPLDLAAIARAAAAAREEPEPVTGGYPAPTPGVPAPAPRVPAPAPPASHRAPRSGRAASTTRAAGALALFGALAGASVAAAGTGPSFLADPSSDTGEIARPALAVAPAGLSEPVGRAGAAAPHTAASGAPRATTATPTTSAAPPAVHDDGGRTL